MMTRWLWASLLMLLCGCGSPRLELNASREMTRDDLFARASHIFLGVIESQHVEEWPLFRAGGPDQKSWRPVRRRVRVEAVVRGVESRSVIDVWEIVSTLAVARNFTENGDRAVFPVRVEDGAYRLTRDLYRSIFRINTGRHTRLPMDDSHPMTERVALLDFWLESGFAPSNLIEAYAASGSLSIWRQAKLYRGLLRHPSLRVRDSACKNLIEFGLAQTECLEENPGQEDRRRIRTSELEQIQDVAVMWRRLSNPLDKEFRQLLTTVADRKARAEYCRLYALEYPGDTDNGCPADRPPPATIVTERGDVPLPGPWPNP